MDRPNGGFGRGFSQGNGIEVHQAPTDRPQPDRPGENWSMPIKCRKKGKIVQRGHETSQALPPNIPPPMGG